jgi:phage terminase small subunit
MPLKNGRLTRVERKFSEAYAVTGDASYSGTKAGYALPHARASEALQRPAVQEEIRRIQVERLFQEVLPLAVKVHLAILADDKTPAGARVQAVKLAYDRTLGDPNNAESKQAHEMSPDELAKAIADAKLRAAALEHVAADRAKPIIEHDKPGILD